MAERAKRKGHSRTCCRGRARSRRVAGLCADGAGRGERSGRVNALLGAFERAPDRWDDRHVPADERVPPAAVAQTPHAWRAFDDNRRRRTMTMTMPPEAAHPVVSRDDWLEARKALLARERA